MVERMSSEEYRALLEGKGKAANAAGAPSAAKRKNKFNAKKVVEDGITFDSKREAERYGQLKLMERAGLISDLKLQVPLFLEGKDGPMLTETGRPMRLTVDFQYTDNKTGLIVWEDAKGKPTRDYLVRKSAAEAQGFKITEV